MAVIGKIRQRSGLLLAFIGFALAAFVLGDFIKNGNKQKQIDIGEVAGEIIPNRDFNQNYERNVDYIKAQQRKNSLSAQESFRVRQQTWDQMVRAILMENEYEALHIEVSNDELKDMITGPNPHPAIVQSFTNPQTGQYDPQLATQQIAALANAPAAQRMQWDNFQKGLKEDRKNTKFENLITKSFYTPKALAEMAYQDENTKAEIRYAAARYSDVADSLAIPSESDYKNYYEEHKALYTQDASRDLEYVVFNVSPSADDKEKLAKEVNEIYTEMKGIALNDVPSFVNANSDSDYDSTWLRKAQIPVNIDEMATNGMIGDISEPYFSNNTFFISELFGKELRSDSLKASHILIAYQGALRANPEIKRTAEQAKTFADSLLAVIKKSPKKFDELAKSESDGPSADKAGDLGWFTDGAMVPEFNTFVQNGQTNELGIVQTAFGYHIIKITGKKEPEMAYRIATIQRQLLPSDRTYQNVYQKASAFAVKSRNLAEFNNTVKEENLNKRVANDIKTVSAYIAGIESPREIIRWSFNKETEQGQVSDVFEDGAKYVVVAVKASNKKGTLSLENAKEKMRPMLINQKKGEILTAKMTGSDLYEIAKDVNTNVENVKSISFASRNIPGFGMENKVIGTIFRTQEGQVSPAIAGNAAAFVVKVEKVTPAMETEDLSNIRKQLETAFTRRVAQGFVFKAMENKAEIIDNRVQFF